ncbi:MAG: hypothetical protein KC492_35360 [Myxococcales bacterium]|nr:hypothetical protein [Myxococcales bacterium]
MKSIAPQPTAPTSDARLLRRWGRLEVRARRGQLEVYGNLDALEELSRIERCHAVDHPLLPKVASRVDSELGVSLLFEAEVYCDFESFVSDLEQTPEAKIPYCGALSLGEQLAEGLHALAEANLCQGALGWCNVLLSPHGNMLLLAGATPELESPIPVQRAPELSGGAPASACADVYVLLMLLERLRAVSEVPEVQNRVLRGDIDAALEPYARAFAEAHLKGMSMVPLTRHANMREALNDFHELWRMTGHWSAPEELQAFFATCVERMRAGSHPRLEIGPDCAWLVLPSGQRVDLARSPVLRRIARQLIDTHCTLPGRFVSLRNIIRAGWPEQELERSAASNRAYVTLSKLRSRVFGDLLETGEVGWRLLPQVVVDRAESS